jgi:hypothetical protein
VAFECDAKMATTIKAEAVGWFVSKFGINSNAVYASKFYIPEKSWTQQSAWWFEIPLRIIETPKSAEIHLLCQIAPSAKDFHCLKVPVEFLKKERSNLCVRKNGKVSLFLSAEQDEMFVEKRGNGKVSFGQLLKITNLAT